MAILPSPPECSGGVGGGGGIWTTGHLEVAGSTLHGNAATGGTGCTSDGVFLACSWSHGGAIAVATGVGPDGASGPAATILASTVSGNAVTTGSGAGLWVADAHAEVGFATFADNEVPPPPPDLYLPPGMAISTTVIYPQWPIFDGTVSLAATLVQGTVGLCDDGTASAGFNVAADATCGLDQPTDLPATAVALAPLADLGGSTPGHLPAAAAPTVDAIPLGEVGMCDGSVPVDQRGLLRAAGSGCDVGAIERQPG